MREVTQGGPAVLSQLGADCFVEVNQIPGHIDIVGFESGIEQRIECGEVEGDLAVLHGQADGVEIGA